MAAQAETLIVYYSYTNNVERIVNELRAQIEADVIGVEHAEKGLDYVANNYAIGSAQITAIRNNSIDASLLKANSCLPVFGFAVHRHPMQKRFCRTGFKQ